MLVQNREVIAEPTLPDVVRAIGVAVKKRSPDVLLAISLYSDDDPESGRPYYDALFLSDSATINVKDAIARVRGVGDVAILVAPACLLGPRSSPLYTANSPGNGLRPPHPVRCPGLGLQGRQRRRR